MRKILITLLLTVAACSGAWAQKGMQGVGLGACMNAPDNAGVGFTLRYYYNFSDYFRIQPTFSAYGGEDNDVFIGSVLLNGHVFFSAPKRCRPYFLAGLGYAEYVYPKYYGSYYTEEDDHSLFGGNAGLGLDWRLSHHWSLQAEAGVLTNFEEAGFMANLCFVYNF